MTGVSERGSLMAIHLHLHLYSCASPNHTTPNPPGLGVEHDLYALTVGCLPLPLLLAGAQALAALLDRLQEQGPPRVLHIPPVAAAAAAGGGGVPPPLPAAPPVPPAAEPAAVAAAAAVGALGEGAAEPAQAAPAAANGHGVAAPPPPPQAPAPAPAARPPWHARLRAPLRRGGEAALLLALWLGVAPLLLGLLFELAVGVPARVPLEAAPVLPIFEGACRACLTHVRA